MPSTMSVTSRQAAKGRLRGVSSFAEKRKPWSRQQVGPPLQEAFLTAERGFRFSVCLVANFGRLEKSLTLFSSTSIAVTDAHVTNAKPRPPLRSKWCRYHPK